MLRKHFANEADEGIEDVELMDTAAIVRDKPKADENTLTSVCAQRKFM